MNVRRQDRPCELDSVDKVVHRTRGRITHRRPVLRHEVLNDDFLHVAVTSMARRDRFESLDPVLAGLPEADQDPCGERDGQLPGPLQRRQAALRVLIGGPSMRGEVRIEGFDHHSLARRHRAQPREVILGECTRIRVREQTRRLEYVSTCRNQVVHRRCVSVFVEPGSRLGVPVFGVLAEGEQSFVAPGECTLGRDRFDLIQRQVRGREVSRGLRERAITATVSTQMGERDEYLRRERHATAHALSHQASFAARIDRGDNSRDNRDLAHRGTFGATGLSLARVN